MTTTAKVIVKRYGDNRTIWIREDYLCEATGVKSDYLWKFCRPNFLKSLSPSQRTRELLPATGTSWRFAKMGGTFYYDYNFIPDVQPTCYRSQLPSERQLLDFGRNPFTENEYEALLKEHLVQEAGKCISAEERYSSMVYYMTNNGKYNFNASDAERLVEAYIVAKYVALARTGNGYMRWGFDKLKGFDKAVCDFLQEKCYPNFKVSSSATLRRKLNEFITAERMGKGLDIFISDKYNNDNRSIVRKTDVFDRETGEVYQLSLHELVMYGLWNGGGAEYGNLSKKKKVMLYDQYVEEMTRYGYAESVISYRTFAFHTDKWETKLFLSKGRDGDSAHNNKHRSYVLTEGVKNPMSLWVADGTGTKMVFQHQGKMRTLYRVNIFDVASQKVVGYSIQTKLGAKVDKEEAWMFRDALIMAIEQSGGRVARELLSDNGGAFSKGETKEICTALFPKYRTIAPGNSQENQAETLQRLMFNFCRRYSNFVGSRMGNIQDENRTTNFKNLDISKLPTFEEAVNQQIQLVEEWNNYVGADGLSPNNRFYGDGGENLKRDDWGVKPDETLLRYALGMRTRMHLGWMRGKLKIEQGNETYYYEIDLATNANEINRRTGYQNDAEVLVCHDGSVADIYTVDGSLICSCNMVTKSFKSEYEATDESRAGMGKQRFVRAKFDNKVEQLEDELEDANFRMPMNGEMTDYGFAVAGKSRVKEDIQDVNDYFLNQEFEDSASVSVSKRKLKEEAMTPEQRAIESF